MLGAARMNRTTVAEALAVETMTPTAMEFPIQTMPVRTKHPRQKTMRTTTAALMILVVAAERQTPTVMA